MDSKHPYSVFNFYSMEGPLVARGTHLWQPYLVWLDRLQWGTTCDMTGVTHILTL